MDAQTAPPKAPPRPSAQHLKHQICTVVQQLTSSGAPIAWQSWDAEKTRRFIVNVQGCHTGRSLASLAISAKAVAEAYGRNPREILPPEVFE